MIFLMGGRMGSYTYEINKSILIIKYFSNDIFKGSRMESYTYEINKNVLIIKHLCHTMA